MNDENQTAPSAGKSVDASAIVELEMPTPTGNAPVSSVTVPAETKPAGDVEKDARGTAFDPSRHTGKKNRHTGIWMPKGGRKKKFTQGAEGQAGNHIPSRAGSSPAPAPSASFIPENEPAAPAAETEARERSEAAEPSGGADHSEDAAEVVCRAAQLGAGFVFDAPEDCTPAGAEHKSMVKATAGYIRLKGWQATAGVALAIVFAAWVLRILNKPKPQAKVRSWLNLDRMENVTPETENPARTPAASRERSASIIDLPSHVPPLAKF